MLWSSKVSSQRVRRVQLWMAQKCNRLLDVKLAESQSGWLAALGLASMALVSDLSIILEYFSATFRPGTCLMRKRRREVEFSMLPGLYWIMSQTRKYFASSFQNDRSLRRRLF